MNKKHKIIKKKDIKSLSKKELIHWLNAIGEKNYKAEQILKWIYQHQHDSFHTMHNLNKNLKKILDQNFKIERLSLKSLEKSNDGSKKYAFKLYDGNIIECLLIPEKKHLTLCVSSQVGCNQKCLFCMTSKNGLIRNLTSDEIIAQVRDIQNKINIKENEMKLSNIVFMGMGEPLSNYNEVLKALKVISNGDYGLKISAKHITISTVGIIPKIKKLGTEANINLTVSINSTNNRIRNYIMPINKKYPIEELIKTCKEYPLKKRQKITFSYVLIKGINDTINDANNLALLLKNTKSKINLIPFNEHSKSNFKRPSIKNIIKFQKILINNKYTVTVRQSKGIDISGACGQLGAK